MSVEDCLTYCDRTVNKSKCLYLRLISLFSIYQLRNCEHHYAHGVDVYVEQTMINFQKLLQGVIPLQCYSRLTHHVTMAFTAFLHLELPR